MGNGHISGIPPLTLTSSSPWCHQMSPRFGDISEDPVAPLEGHLAGFIAATCVTQHSKPWLLSSQSCRRHRGQCLLKDRRHGIHGQGSHHIEILPLQTKSQHVQPGPCGVHLPAQETLTHTCSHLRPSWGDLQRGGPQAAGAMVRKVSTEVSWHCSSVLGASLPRAVTGCESYLAQGSAYCHTMCPNLRLAFQQTLICHRCLRERTARCLQRKVTWCDFKHFNPLPY